MPRSHMLTAMMTLMPMTIITCRKYWLCTVSGSARSAMISTRRKSLDIVAEQPPRADNEDYHQDGEVDDEGQFAAQQRAGQAVGDTDEQAGQDGPADTAHAADLHDDEGLQQRLRPHLR